MLALCHLLLAGQALTNALPSAELGAAGITTNASDNATAPLPEDPGQEILPIAVPEPVPAAGVPVQLDADRQTRVGDVLTLDGNVVVHYRDYILRAPIHLGT